MRVLCSVLSLLLCCCWTGLTAADQPGTGSRKRPPAASTPSVWRPFSPDSPWNTPIPVDATLDPLSRDYARQLANSCPKWPFVSLNFEGYSIPVFFADKTTPTYHVSMLAGREKDRDEASLKPVPIPTEARPSVGTDAHLCIIDLKAGLSWEFWGVFTKDRKQFSQKNWLWSDQTWGASSVYVVDLAGSGVRPPCGTVSPWQLSFGCRASGFPLIAGLVRAEELEVGDIRHALVLNYPRLRANWIVPPASAMQAPNSNELTHVTEDSGLPVGARVRLDPDLDLASLGADKVYLPILRALQVYGAFIGDCSGSISLCLDENPQAQERMRSLGIRPNGLAQVLTAPILERHLQVVRMPDQWYYRNQGAKPRPDQALVTQRLAELKPTPEKTKPRKATAPQPAAHRQPSPIIEPQASEEARTYWDDRLRSRVTMALAAGKQPAFTMHAMRQDCFVVSLNAKGEMELLAGGSLMSWTWQRLDPVDRASLGVGCDRCLPTKDQALAAFWYRLSGDIETSDSLLLYADAVDAARVRADVTGTETSRSR